MQSSRREALLLLHEVQHARLVSWCEVYTTMQSSHHIVHSVKRSCCSKKSKAPGWSAGVKFTSRKKFTPQSSHREAQLLLQEVEGAVIPALHTAQLLRHRQRHVQLLQQKQE